MFNAIKNVIRICRYCIYRARWWSDVTYSTRYHIAKFINPEIFRELYGEYEAHAALGAEFCALSTHAAEMESKLRMAQA